MAGISCTSAETCLVVGGGYDEGPGNSGEDWSLAENHGQWGSPTVLNAPAGTYDFNGYSYGVSDVSCESSSYCMAVGSYVPASNTSTENAMVATATWTD